MLSGITQYTLDALVFDDVGVNHLQSDTTRDLEQT